MRWLWLALLLSSAACERPRVLPTQDDATAPSASDSEPAPSIEEATQLVRALAEARNTHDPAHIKAHYAKDARILVWRKSSSWSYVAETWARELAKRQDTSTVARVYLVGVNRHTRVVLVIDRRVGAQLVRSLEILELHREDDTWRVKLEAVVDELDLSTTPLAGYSDPIMGDLSYRASPEIAVLRLRGSSDNQKSLALSELAKGNCPPPPCDADLEVDLLTISLEGDKLLDTALERHRDTCADVPLLRLAGAVQILERDALVIERITAPCGGRATLLATSIIGVRGQLTTTLLSMERSRVIEVRENSVTVEHRTPADELKAIRFVASKEQDRLVFRAEPAD